MIKIEIQNDTNIQDITYIFVLLSVKCDMDKKNINVIDSIQHAGLMDKKI